METTNENQGCRSDDAIWYLLAESSLSAYMSDHLQTFRELGIPPECVDSIELTLRGFTQEEQMQAKQEGYRSTGRIRVFCQKKMIDDFYLVKSSKPANSEHATEYAEMINHSANKMDGGWGYFLIERRDNLSASSSASSGDSIDLYLYKEGE